MKQDGSICKSETVYCAEERLYLSYHLTVTRTEEGGSAYDLTVEQMGTGGHEHCRLCDIAFDRQSAERLWRLFAKERVTPITAEDVMEGLLSDEAFLYAE